MSRHAVEVEGVSKSFGAVHALTGVDLHVAAGTVLGSGTISNHDRAAGFACIAEQRMVETIEHGKPRTEYLKPGDRVSIEMKDADGHSIFGSIRQTVGEPGVA